MYLIQVSKHSPMNPNAGKYFRGFSPSFTVIDSTDDIMQSMVFDDIYAAKDYHAKHQWFDAIVWIAFVEPFNYKIRVMRDCSDMLLSFRDYAVAYSSREILTAFAEDCLGICDVAGAKLTMRQTADIMCTMALADENYNIFKKHLKSWQGALLMLFSIFEACELNVPDKALNHDLHKRLFADFMDDELNVLPKQTTA